MLEYSPFNIGGAIASGEGKPLKRTRSAPLPSARMPITAGLRSAKRLPRIVIVSYNSSRLPYDESLLSRSERWLERLRSCEENADPWSVRDEEEAS